MPRIDHQKDGWTIRLDSDQIIKDDPGAGTPALVIAPDGSTGTYWCAFNMEECDGQKIPPSIVRWIENMLPVVDQFLMEHDDVAPIVHGDLTFSATVGVPDDDVDIPETPRFPNPGLRA